MAKQIIVYPGKTPNDNFYDSYPGFLWISVSDSASQKPQANGSGWPKATAAESALIQSGAVVEKFFNLVLPAGLDKINSGAVVQAILQQLYNNADNASCTSSCAVTVTSTGSGHLLVAGIISSNSTAATISSVTAAACSGSWVHCTNCSLANSTGNVDFSYCLNSASGQTSITITPSATLSAGIGVIWEAQSTLGNIAKDSGTTPSGTHFDSSSCTTTCAGVSLTLSGNNDFIAAVASCGGTCSAVSGTGWTNDKSNPGGDAAAHGITSGTQTAPTTYTQTSGLLVCAAIAFQETSSGSSTAPGRMMTQGVGK